MKNSFWYHFFRLTLGPLFKFYYTPKIYNKDALNIDGPFVVACNHKHIYDQCLVIISTNKKINYMAKKEYFDNPKTRWFFKAVDAISVDRSKKDSGSKEKAINVLKNNGYIGIFPEGTRNKTEKFLLPFKFGAVSIASKTDAWIIPCGLTGDYKFRSKNLKITFGKPFKVGDLSMEEANDRLYHDIEKLMKNNLEK